MDEFALVPHSLMADQEIPNPVAEQNFQRKKMQSLEQGIGKLQKTARLQHEVVTQLESGLKNMISEADLRRAIGLAFQEFENRIEDAFQDSNRKCLQMFSKRDEFSEIQAVLSKKVNWTEYNAVLKKLAELRQYIDTMAESVFIGQREALESEFNKKADAAWVEEGLKAKADFTDLNEVRARLERLEVLVSHQDSRHSARVEALREESQNELTAMVNKQTALIAEANATISQNKDRFKSVGEQLTGFGEKITGLESGAAKMLEAQQVLEKLNQTQILPQLASAEEHFASLDESTSEIFRQLESLTAGSQDLRDFSGQKFNELSSQGNSFKEQIDFLMQATDMIKRRSREMTKTTTAKFKELEDDQDKHLQQLASVERVLKKQEREVKAIENRASRAIETSDTAVLKALPMLESQNFNPNDRLQVMLEQLEKIATGGSLQEQSGVEWNPSRPPLPVSGAESARTRGAESLRYSTGSPEQVPIDSARGAPMSSNIGGTYGLSPRAPPAGSKAVRMKKGP